MRSLLGILLFLVSSKALALPQCRDVGFLIHGSYSIQQTFLNGKTLSVIETRQLPQEWSKSRDSMYQEISVHCVFKAVPECMGGPRELRITVKESQDKSSRLLASVFEGDKIYLKTKNFAFLSILPKVDSAVTLVIGNATRPLCEQSLMVKR